ncbi:M48 family metalloprotease [Microbulbifer pacificus]|uniref:M48 family metalloprotease n=1 Tax=Microbulbifer pacificus TaxID=407164 RepID=UPI0018F87CD7|nr:M48 family metalloprotease [Microbulbifer pacificus]
MGTNAFALSGGTIILIDELIARAEHENEILAVFGHELGHVHHQHTLRHIIEGSAITFMKQYWVLVGALALDACQNMEAVAPWVDVSNQVAKNAGYATDSRLAPVSRRCYIPAPTAPVRSFRGPALSDCSYRKPPCR